MTRSLLPLVAVVALAAAGCGDGPPAGAEWPLARTTAPPARRCAVRPTADRPATGWWLVAGAVAAGAVTALYARKAKAGDAATAAGLLGLALAVAAVLFLPWARW